MPLTASERIDHNLIGNQNAQNWHKQGKGLDMIHPYFYLAISSMAMLQ